MPPSEAEVAAALGRLADAKDAADAIAVEYRGVKSQHKDAQDELKLALAAWRELRRQQASSQLWRDAAGDA